MMGHVITRPWWRHQMETFSALLVICAGNSPVPGEFPSHRPVTRSFDVFFDLRLNKRLSKQWWGWWFETLSHPLWRHRNASNWPYWGHQGPYLVPKTTDYWSSLWSSADHWPYAPGVCSGIGKSWRILHSWLVEDSLRDSSWVPSSSS